MQADVAATTLNAAVTYGRQVVGFAAAVIQVLALAAAGLYLEAMTALRFRAEQAHHRLPLGAMRAHAPAMQPPDDQMREFMRQSFAQEVITMCAQQGAVQADQVVFDVGLPRLHAAQAAVYLRGRKDLLEMYLRQRQQPSQLL